jgi:hypothetical protein
MDASGLAAFDPSPEALVGQAKEYGENGGPQPLPMAMGRGVAPRGIMQFDK